MSLQTSRAPRCIAAAGALLAALAWAGPAATEAVLLAADSAHKGASVADNKVYLAVAEEITAQLRKAGHTVVEPAAIPQQYMPPKRRLGTADWVWVFGHNVPPTDALVTVAVVNRITRTPSANLSSVDLEASIFRRGTQKPVTTIEQPAKKDWPMSAGCFGPCMMRVLSENVKAPAAEFGQKIVQALQKTRARK